MIKTRYGWKTEIVNAPLRYVFQQDKNSWAFKINDVGIVAPNSKIKYSVLILSLLPALKFGLFWMMFVLPILLSLGLLLYISIVAILSPISRDVRRESVKYLGYKTLI